jgi:hypothetical protein
MVRHGKKFCMICNPEGNGSTGMEGTEAIGRYYLQRASKNQFNSGWIAVCSGCAEATEKYFRIEYFNGAKTVRLTDNKDPRLFAGPYEHHWEKQNLVTMEIEGKAVDHLICSKCGAGCYFFMRAIAPHDGCKVPDIGGN